MKTVQFECISCHKRFYINLLDAHEVMTGDINVGDVFPIRCPFCDEGRQGVIVED